MQTYTIRDLHTSTRELVRDAKAGKLSLVTQHGQPVIVFVPFDETLLNTGIHVAMAVQLFREDAASLRKAARLAGMRLVEFKALLARMNIPMTRP